MSVSESISCANTESPAKAILVCWESGCTAYPFMCGRESCSCMVPHAEHTSQMTKGIIKKLMNIP